jgi:anhydro-N-acetylmuramic acid kinase
MTYHALGLMSGSSLDGLDLALVRLEERAGQWSYNWIATDCVPYSEDWIRRLKQALELPVPDFLRLHTAYGHYTGQVVRDFLSKHAIKLKVDFIGSHGHTVFHDPSNGTTSQIGDGASIAAETGIPVICDLRNMDLAYGGQGAPIVPLGEKLLFPGFRYLLNLGGIANLSVASSDEWKAYDLCACNQLLNAIAAERGLEYDKDGKIADSGFVNDELLFLLNDQEFFKKPAPKSLDNGFSKDVLLPIIQKSNISLEDKMRTIVEHIVLQIVEAVRVHPEKAEMLVTGGGALNNCLFDRLDNALAARMVKLTKPDQQTIQFKEALIMALLAALRWRGEATTIPSATGARKASIGGALWLP